jgi:Mrp family chromosome partitioning ATPase
VIDPDLLGSSQMRHVITRLASDSDYLLIDGPPACDSTDAEFLAEHMDAVLLVVRSGHCSRSELKQISQRLRESGKQLLGVILTQVDPRYLRTA